MAEISQNYVFAINEIAQVQFTDRVGISEIDEDVFNAEDLLQAQPLEQAVLIQQNLFTDVAELAQAQLLDGTKSGAIFVIDELSQAQLLEGVITGTLFDVDDLNQVQLLDTVVLIRNIIYNCDELLQPTQIVSETDLAILIHSFRSATSDVNVTSLSVDVPPDASDGDFLLAILATDGAGETHSADGAWTIVESDLDSGGHTLSAYKRTVTGTPEPASYNFTWGSAEKVVGVILLVRGTSLNPLQIKGKKTGRSIEPFSVAVTPVIDNNLYLSINTQDQAGANFFTITYPTGLKNELNVSAGPQSGVAIQVGSKIISDTSTEPINVWLMSKKDNWYTLSLLIESPTDIFDAADIGQAQTVDPTDISHTLDELIQTHSVQDVQILSSSADHQILTFGINQAQPLDPTTIVHTLGSLLVVQDEKAMGTAGGDSSAGANTRVLNTIVINSIAGASLASDQITLPAGEYEIRANAPSAESTKNRLYLYNITDAQDELIGTSYYSNAFGGWNAGGSCWLEGRFTITSEKDFEIRHYIETAKTGTGLGIGGNDGINNEVFAQVVIWKV